MEELYNRKYQKVLSILPDFSKCAQENLILVGGTALAIFYLHHRVSVDLDLVPLDGDDVKLKEEVKGCLTKKGYRTQTGAFKNQFVVQFEDTSIKIEMFVPEIKIKKIEEYLFANTKIKVASLEDLYQMKLYTYGERKEARDLFDIFSILKYRQNPLDQIKELIAKNGKPENMAEIEKMAINLKDALEFKKVVSDATAP